MLLTDMNCNKCNNFNVQHFFFHFLKLSYIPKLCFILSPKQKKKEMENERFSGSTPIACSYEILWVITILLLRFCKSHSWEDIKLFLVSNLWPWNCIASSIHTTKANRDKIVIFFPPKKIFHVENPILG